ncbi:MAG: protein translocase subunit SecD [Gemmatimonadetes bacterium]|nr:protein translocase subunit SecD [Gemmatimonadota bacterium]
MFEPAPPRLISPNFAQLTRRMFKTLRGRIVTIVVIVAIAAWQLIAHRNNTGDWLKLGLDLQGGMHLVLEVDDPQGTMTSDARADMIARVEMIVRTRIDEFGVAEPLIQRVGSERMIVELAGVSDEEQAKGIVTRNAFLEFKLVQQSAMDETALRRVDRAIVAALGVDSIRAMGRAVEDRGETVEDILFRRDSTAADSAAAAATAAADSAQAAADALRPFSSLLGYGDIPGTFMVDVEDVPAAQHFLGLPEVQRSLPRDVSLQWGTDLVPRGVRNYQALYTLTADAFLTGDQLENASAQRDPQFNQSIVNFELSREGGREFSRFSAANVGNYLAIVLDGEVMSAPVIRDRIGARGQIEMGQGTPLEVARDLALVLRAGALPARISIIEERTVGPSLGQDSIDAGVIAGVVGTLAVVILMIGYYRLAGVLAVGALAFYVLLILGGMAAIDATLTLPGIAGIILSIGMAVDANVLIFERIREELHAGRATRTAVDEGFANALSAIVDSNITTLITGLVLFQFGTGPVRGFAVTMSIGILASFVSAIFVTKTLFLVYLQGKRASDPISI